MYQLDEVAIEKIKCDFVDGSLPHKLVGKELQLMKQGPSLEIALCVGSRRVGFLNNGVWEEFKRPQVDMFFDSKFGGALAVFEDNIPRKIRPWVEIEAGITSVRDWANGKTDETGVPISPKERSVSPVAGACEIECPRCGEEFTPELPEPEIVSSWPLLVDNNGTPLNSVLSGAAYKNALKSGVFLRAVR